MDTYTYQFECTVLLRKILKLAKKNGCKSFFKEGFEFDGQYYIGLEKSDEEKDLFIETLEGEFWRNPLRKKGPKKGLKWWPDESQIPDKKTIEILEKFYAFLKA